MSRPDPADEDNLVEKFLKKARKSGITKEALSGIEDQWDVWDGSGSMGSDWLAEGVQTILGVKCDSFEEADYALLYTKTMAAARGVVDAQREIAKLRAEHENSADPKLLGEIVFSEQVMLGLKEMAIEACLDFRFGTEQLAQRVREKGSPPMNCYGIQEMIEYNCQAPNLRYKQ